MAIVATDPLIRDETAAGVFTAIVTRGPLSRRDLSKVTGLSQSTITKVVRPMVEAGYVVEEREEAQGPGRPAIPLRVNCDRHYVVGVKIAPHELIGVVTDPQARVLVSGRRALAEEEPKRVVAEVAELVDALLDGEPGLRDSAEGLGVALGGHVDPSSRSLRYSPILGWRDVPLAALLEEATGLYSVVENDVNALAVAEQWFGAGRDVASFAVVTVGAGVGCGLVLDHQLMHGATGMAGELGHVVIDPDGETCRCGARGCLETIASDGAILAAICGAGSPPHDIAEAALRARHGDVAARAAFARAGTALGRGIAILLNLVNPSRVILSGEGVVASDLLMDELRASLERHAFAGAARDCEVVTRPLSDETWARGAASNALRHLIAGSLGRPLAFPSRAGG